MEMGFASADTAATGTPALRDASNCVPDWHVLKARFAAAHALRAELAATAIGLRAGGSFAQDGAQTLAATRDSSSRVNLTVSGNCKARSGKTGEVIGTPTPLTGESYD